MFNFFNKKKDEKNIRHISTFENKKNITEIKQDSLIESVEKYDIDLVKKLIKQGININKQNRNGDTALSVAVILKPDEEALDKRRSKKYEIIKCLLENKADVYQKNNYNYNVLQIMSGKSDYYEIRKIFNKYGYFKEENFQDTNINKDFIQKLKEEPFIQAIKNSDKNKLSELMTNHWKEINQPKYYSMTLLYYAVLFKNIDMIEFLLDKGANSTIKNKEKFTYDHEIERACYYTRNIVFNISSVLENRVLEEYKRFTDNHGGKTPLDLATENNLSDIKKLFLEKNNLFIANKLINGVSPLYTAVINQNINLVKKLLDDGADINLKNSDDISYDDTKLTWYRIVAKTPVEASIYVGDLDILKLLMEYNPNIDALLELSVSEEKSEMLELLIRKGANFNFTKNKYGDKFVALKSACAKQNLKIVKILIENGADVNITGYEGQTALFDAIEATRANKEIIRYLIKNGADIYKEDDKGISPLIFAQSNKKSLVKVLTEHVEVTLSKNQDSNIMENYQTLANKILEQNEVINKLKNEVKTIKNSDEYNKIGELELQISAFKETINLMDSLILKVNKLEKKLNKQKVVKTKIPINIPVENHSIKKDDGVIVKRESFDDF